MKTIKTKARITLLLSTLFPVILKSSLKNFVLLVALIFIWKPVLSQDVVMNNEPEELYKEAKGPQSKNYFHPYISYGLIPDINKEPGAKIKTFFSDELSVGIRYKRKVFSFYHIGFDISGRLLQYKIKDDLIPPNILNPFSQYWGKGIQFLKINTFGAEIYNRLRFGKGNNLGYYIDGGIRADYNYLNKWIIKSEYNKEENPAGKVKVINRKLDFMKRSDIYFSGRVGFKKIIIYNNYRFTNFFQDNYEIPEFPRLIVGLQWAL